MEVTGLGACLMGTVTVREDDRVMGMRVVTAVQCECLMPLSCALQVA